MATVTEWLRAMPHVISATPVRVTIKGTTYEGSRYVSRLESDPTTEAYRRGERSYTREMIYLVGDLPRHYVRRNKAAYTMPGDEREWYICGYWDGRDNPFNPDWREDAPKYHPFGRNFQLAPWQVPTGEKIDHYERKPYDRVALEIEEG